MGALTGYQRAASPPGQKQQTGDEDSEDGS